MQQSSECYAYIYGAAVFNLCRPMLCLIRSYYAKKYEFAVVFSCVAYRRQQIIGYSAGVLVLPLLLLLKKYDLLTLTADNSTTVTPGPTVTIEPVSYTHLTLPTNREV